MAAQAGIFNVGGEGQLYLGAIASAYVGARLTGVTPWIALPLCFLAAIAAGGLYAWIPAVLKVKMKVNEVITTIMMNSAAIYFCSYLANGPLKTPSGAFPPARTRWTRPLCLAGLSSCPT